MVEKLRFPLLDEETFEFFGNLEEIEDLFGIEFSCGDGLFLSDLCDAALHKYDGNVDVELFRNKDGLLCRSEDYYLRFGWCDDDPRAEVFSDCKVIKYRGSRSIQSYYESHPYVK